MLTPQEKSTHTPTATTITDRDTSSPSACGFVRVVVGFRLLRLVLVFVLAGIACVGMLVRMLMLMLMAMFVLAFPSVFSGATSARLRLAGWEPAAGRGPAPQH